MIPICSRRTHLRGLFSSIALKFNQVANAARQAQHMYEQRKISDMECDIRLEHLSSKWNAFGIDRRWCWIPRRSDEGYGFRQSKQKQFLESFFNFLWYFASHHIVSRPVNMTATHVNSQNISTSIFFIKSIGIWHARCWKGWKSSGGGGNIRGIFHKHSASVLVPLGRILAPYKRLTRISSLNLRLEHNNFPCHKQSCCCKVLQSIKFWFDFASKKAKLTAMHYLSTVTSARDVFH